MARGSQGAKRHFFRDVKVALACAQPVLPCTTVCENSRDCLSSYSDLSSRLSLAKDN
jgi:hypothetical protein